MMRKKALSVGELRAEHAHLHEHVDRLREAAREIPTLSIDAREELIRRVLDFLEGSLLPHADEEESSVYPLVAELLGDRRATATMLSDHTAIVERVRHLGQTRADETDRLQELLYGLHALLTVHFWKEEKDYLPLLELAAYEREPVLTHEP
jgi:hemerythrin